MATTQTSTSSGDCPSVDYSCPGMLHQILSSEDYALALTPGFFRFYAHIGILQALEERGCLRPSHVSGSSAGALVGGFLASGMTPTQMIKAVLEIKRADIWDVGGSGGLLKGQLFQELVERNLPVRTFEECPIPLGVTTFDLLRCKTQYITGGCLATAMRTSCTFPGLFQPVQIDGSPNIDGGVFDGVGLMALPHALGLESNTTRCESANTANLASTTRNNGSTMKATTNNSSSSNSSPVAIPAKPALSRVRSKSLLGIGNSSSTVMSLVETERAVQQHLFDQLVVNIVFGRSSISSSVLPAQLSTRKLLTVVVENIPMVHPFSMDSMGIVAYRVARAATLRALHSTHMQELAPHHWCCYVDGLGVNPDLTPRMPIDPKTRESLRAALRRSSSGDSSSESVAIEHSWTTQAARRRKGGAKRKHRSDDAALATATANTAPTGFVVEKKTDTMTCNSNSDDGSSSSDSDNSRSSNHSSTSEGSDTGDSDQDVEPPAKRRGGYLSIPSFAFLNGTYRLYHDAYSSTMHTIEDATSAVSTTLHSLETSGSAIITDASNALSSAKKRLNKQSQVLYSTMRSTIGTVVQELGGASEMESDLCSEVASVVVVGEGQAEGKEEDVEQGESMKVTSSRRTGTTSSNTSSRKGRGQQQSALRKRSTTKKTTASTTTSSSTTTAVAPAVVATGVARRTRSTTQKQTVE